MRDVDADLSHGIHSAGIQSLGVGAGAGDLEMVICQTAQESFRHLAAARVSGTEKEHPPLHETPTPSGCSKRSSNKAAGKTEPKAYPLGYVEDSVEPRTKLEGFFSILLGKPMSRAVAHRADGEHDRYLN